MEQGKVTVDSLPDPAILESSTLFRDWKESLDPSFDLKGVTLQSVDMFGPRIGFLKFNSHIERGGVRIPGICLLRGSAVAMLIRLIDEETGKEYSILTEQPRVATGGLLREIPAGMTDGSGDFRGVAIKELEEECGLHATVDQLVDLTQFICPNGGGVYTSPGLLDEYIRLFYWKLTLPHSRIEELNGKLGGEDEHEQITLRIVPYDEVVFHCPDMKTISALHLAQMYEEGKLPHSHQI